MPRDARRAIHDLDDTDLDMRAHQAMQLSAGVPSTRERYRRDMQWDPDRLALHQQIIDRVIARYDHVPRSRRAVMAGGLPGAGKTSVLRGQADHLMPIDPDEMKAELIAAGGLPDVPGGEHLSPMELSTVLHLESSWLADQLLRRAAAEGIDVLIDATMGEQAAPRSRIELLQQHGYSIRGMFVDVDVDTSLRRTQERYRRAMRRWAAGQGPGGRPVPPQFIEQSRRAPGEPTANRQVFEMLAAMGMFDAGWEVHDNNGDAPRLLAQS